LRVLDAGEGPVCHQPPPVPRLGSASPSKEGALSATASFLIFIPGMTILSFLIGAIIMTVAMSDNVEPEDDEAAEAPAAH
jgi:ABC-type dipeptide/oligopeptide/nickel transport system permease subunit